MCNAHGQLGVEEFEIAMREQMLNYTQSRLSATSELWNVSDQDFTELGTLKQFSAGAARRQEGAGGNQAKFGGYLNRLQSERKDSDTCACAGA